ncbi:MAG: hypothetical protein K0R65_2123 [Crocinitomicaceae bacterium]|nr:hypothetical protein [Crocinitomicaceae bacterium]
MIFTAVFLLAFDCFGQDILVLGKNLELKTSLEPVRFTYKEQLKADSLKQFDAVFIFSTANSTIGPEAEKELIDFVNEGGKLYLGAENEPFDSESNQVLKSMFNQQFYGNFNTDSLLMDPNSNFRACDCKKYLSGYTTVSFPMDYRLQVEAWSHDNPIILTGKFGAGKIIIDGGYSRFYDMENSALLDEFLLFFFRE